MEQETPQEYDWRKEALKLPTWKTQVTATLDMYKMLPNKYQPISKRHFVFDLDGIDSFLVKDVTRSPIKKTLFGYQKKGRLVVTLHEAVAPSAAQQVREWLTEGFWKGLRGRTAELKMLDPVGTVIQLTKYSGIKLIEVHNCHLTYSGKDLSEIVLVMEYKNEELCF